MVIGFTVYTAVVLTLTHLLAFHIGRSSVYLEQAQNHMKAADDKLRRLQERLSK